MMPIKAQRAGFSLVEILVVFAIIGMVTAAFFAVILAAQRTWDSGAGQALLTSQLRAALGQMTRELAVSPTDQMVRPAADGNWDTTAIFRVPQDLNGDGTVLDMNGNIVEWSVWLRYLLGANNLLQRKLDTAPTVTFQTLSGNISSIQFRRQPTTPEMVEIQVTATAQKGSRVLTRSMSSRVNLRNIQSGPGAADENPPDDF